LRRHERSCPAANWPVDEPTNKKIWLPEAVVTFTGKPKPSRKGALVFSLGNVVETYPTCSTVKVLTYPVNFTWDFEAGTETWFRWPIPGGFWYFKRTQTLPNDATHEAYYGIDCASKSFMFGYFPGFPCVAIGPYFSGYFFLRVLGPATGVSTCTITAAAGSCPA